MNFDDVWTHEQAQDLAPSPRLVTAEDHRRNRQREHRLLVNEAAERVMTEWRQWVYKDVAAENAFYAQRRAERAARREEKRARKAIAETYLVGDGPDWDDDDPWWDNVWTSSNDNTTLVSEGVVSD
ncbi:unnamed protein product [Alopecurus aequalis]